MKTLLMQQGSTEWLQARLGVITASEVDALVTPLFKQRQGDGVDTYMYRKLAEKLVNWYPDIGTSYHMDQGSMAEKIALPWYNFTYNADAYPVGLCLSEDGKIGCSPDALEGEYSGVEIKFPSAPKHLEYLLKNEVPPAYRAQIHFSMMVTARPRWTFLSFSRVLPPLVIRVERDEKIQAVLREVTDSFLERFDAALAKVKSMRDDALPLSEKMK